MHYVPSAPARALTSGKTKTVAVLVSDVTNPFYFDIIRGTQQQLKAAGYTQLLVDTEESDELEDGMLHRLRRSYDGAILAASRLSERRFAHALRRDPPRRDQPPDSLACRPSSSTPRAASSRRSSTSSRSVTPGSRTPSGPETSWPNEGRWRALQRAAEATRADPRPDRPVRAAPVRRRRGGGRGRERRDHRVHRVQRPARHRHAAAAGPARRLRTRRHPSSWAATTSSAPTSATPR